MHSALCHALVYLIYLELGPIFFLLLILFVSFEFTLLSIVLLIHFFFASRFLCLITDPLRL